MWVHTWFRKWRSWEMMIIVELRWLSTSSSQRIVLMSRLLVGSSSSRMSGLANRAWASSTRSFQPGATSRIGPLCCSVGMPTPCSSSPARASAV
jgi:hypothetical protein